MHLVNNQMKYDTVIFSFNKTVISKTDSEYVRLVNKILRIVIGTCTRFLLQYY